MVACRIKLGQPVDKEDKGHHHENEADHQPGETLDALLEAGFAKIDTIIRKGNKKHFADFMALIERTPELSRYARQMWMRYEKALATAIRKEATNKMGKLESEAIARFVLDSYHRSLGTPNPKASLRRLFRILREGWVD